MRGYVGHIPLQIDIKIYKRDAFVFLSRTIIVCFLWVISGYSTVYAIAPDTTRIINLVSLNTQVSFDNPQIDAKNHFIFKDDKGHYTQHWHTLITDKERFFRSNQLWLKLTLPTYDFNDPVLYFEGIFNPIKVFQDGQMIYPDSGLSKTHQWRYNQFHQISLLSGPQPVELFVQINYNHILELGTSRKILLGERNDILSWAITRQQESVINAIINLLLGFILLFSALMSFLSLFWIEKVHRKVLMPFALLILLAALDYLFAANFSFVPVSPFDFSPMVYELVPFILTIFMPVFLLLFFLRLYPSKIDLVLRIMIGVHLLIGSALAYFVLFPGEMLGILSDVLIVITSVLKK